ETKNSRLILGSRFGWDNRDPIKVCGSVAARRAPPLPPGLSRPRRRDRRDDATNDLTNSAFAALLGSAGKIYTIRATPRGFAVPELSVTAMSFRPHFYTGSGPS